MADDPANQMAKAKIAASAENSHVLSVTYISPSNASFSVTKQIPAPPTSAPAERVVYLSALRKAATSIQKSINYELTQRMEEDNEKATGNEASRNLKRGAIDEGKEEENYGEELEDED